MLAFLKKFKGFFAGFAIAAIAFFFIYAKAINNDSFFEISKNLDIYSNLFRELNTYYVDPIEPGKLVKSGVDAMLEDLDPYTNFITESDIEEYEFMMTGKYGGIGANMHRRGDDIIIGDVFENSPSQKAGLHPGDVVLTVDNQPVTGKSVDDLSNLLKGSPGTKVTLHIRDAYNKVETDKVVTRGEIEVSSVPYAALIGPEKNIAYVKLTQFTQNCSRLVKDAYDSLMKAQPAMKGFVLDLRGNPGGLVDEAVKLCNLFIEKDQLVVSTRGKIPDMDKEYRTSGSVWNKDLPVTVLVNHSSASASEIVSGTLQDLDRGVIIGERSYGKGLVQMQRSLGYNSLLKLTIARYYTPSGRCIQAIDYSHRNADKSASVIPDSLRKTYKTMNGRPVKSGGGIEPDVKLKDDAMSQIAMTLLSKNYFFDYATEYASKHPKIDSASKFKLTDAEFTDFTRWLDKKDYSYKTETENTLDSLKAVAVREHYFDEAAKEFDALKAKMSHDKKQDLLKNKEAVKLLLENEIVSRYYFARGRIAQNMAHDKVLDKAVDLIMKPTELKGILKKQ